MLLQPGVVPLARQPDHRGAAPPRELHGQRSDAARRTGHHDRVPRHGVHGEHGRVRGRTGHVQGTGRLPGQPVRTVDHVHVVDRDELRVARPGVGVAQHLVAHREPAHLRARLHHHTGQITALPGGERRHQRSCRAPSRIITSPGWIPAARTSTSTCPGPGDGRADSSTRSTSIPPYSWNRTAFIA